MHEGSEPVSREVLRAELSEFRVDLMSVLAQKADRKHIHDLRDALTIISGTLQLAVKSIEGVQEDNRETRAVLGDHGHRLDGHDAWRHKIIGGFAVAGFAVGYFVRGGM